MTKSNIILKFIICAFLSFYFSNGFCQDEIDNHKKYWYYKTRLNNDFIKIGTVGSGFSIPFNERGAEYGHLIYHPSYSLNSSEIKAGDASARLGIYLSVLATEYRLLKNSGQDVSKVKHEIFCAMNAINRIDYYAEQIFMPTHAPDLNGFFIRDDIGHDFVHGNYEHFNYYNHGVTGIGLGSTPNAPSQDKGFTQTFTKGMQTNSSSFMGFFDAYYGGQPFEDALHGAEESQDQAYYLLMGLTLTSKLVDNGETDGTNVFGYGSGETELPKEAVNIAGRIIKHMSNDNFWIIRNPSNGNQAVQIGQAATPYAYALDNLGAYIKYNQDMPFFYIPIVNGPGLYPHAINGEFSNLYSRSPIASASYQAIAGADGGPSVDEQGFFNILAGCGNNCFEQMSLVDLGVQQAINALMNQIQDAINQVNTQIANILNNLPSWIPPKIRQAIQNTIQNILNGLQILINGIMGTINTLNQYLHPSVLINTTSYRLAHNSISNPVLYNNSCVYGPNGPMVTHIGSEQYFGIYLKEILHGPTQSNLPSYLSWITNPPSISPLIVRNNVKTLLDEAPCQGNYNFYPNYPSGDHWGASCFLDRPDRLWVKQTCPETFLGEYSGLDYMLMHNLFYLYEGNSQAFYNYSERNVLADMPFPNNTFSTSNKKTLGAFEYIDANNTIHSNGAADYRAGKEVKLEPGFTVQNGADFHAYVDPFQCSGTNDDMSRVAGQNAPEYYGIPAKNKPKGKPLTAEQIKFNEEQVNQALAELQDQLKLQTDSLMRELDKLSQMVAEYTQCSVYPNPNNGDFSLDFKRTINGKVQLQVVDAIGNIVEEKTLELKGSSTIPVSLNESFKGLYILNLTYEDGRNEKVKVTISK